MNIGKINRKPLRQRLQSIGASCPDFPAVFELFAEDYLKELDQRTGGAYLKAVSATLEESVPEENEEIPLVSLMMTDVLRVIKEFPAETKIKLLYLMFIEPYAIPENTIRKE